MTSRCTPYILALFVATMLPGCSSSSGGGGGGGDGDSTTTPSHTVTLSALGGSSSDGNTIYTVIEGQSTVITLTADTGYTLDTTNVSGCGGSLSGETYTTGTILSDCTVSASFIKDASHEPLGLGLGAKQFIFNWPEVSGATYYKLMENPNGASGFTQVGEDIVGTTVAHAIPLYHHDWANARYYIAACNDSSTECLASNEVGTNLETPNDYIAYLKDPALEASDFFGTSVALSVDGNTMAIGATGDGDYSTSSDRGAVYVYVRDTVTGAWSRQAELTAPVRDINDEFGRGVVLSDDGNTLAVAAPYEQSNGTGICISGVTACTTTQQNNTGDDSGAVYVYSRSGTTWNSTTPVYIKASDNISTYMKFGQALSMSADGKTLAVGSDRAGAGGVYLYERGTESWSEVSVITDASAVSGFGFGKAVALSGDALTLAVGSPTHNGAYTGICNTYNGNDCTPEETLDVSEPAAGAVYAFGRDGTSWSSWYKQAFIKAPNAEAGDEFGSSVAMSRFPNGDSVGYGLAVGAPKEDSSTTGVCHIIVDDDACATEMGGDATADEDTGAVYYYRGTMTMWYPKTYIKAHNTGAGDEFGYTVALDDVSTTTLAVGAWYEDGAGQGLDAVDDPATLLTSAGAVYLFDGDDVGAWGQRSYIKAPNPSELDRLGIAMVLSGDGKTLAVSAPPEDSIGEDNASQAVGMCATGETACSEAQIDNSVGNSGAVYLY